jgi:hypothetical protein
LTPTPPRIVASGLLATISSQVLSQASVAPAHWPLIGRVDHQVPPPVAVSLPLAADDRALVGVVTGSKTSVENPPSTADVEVDHEVQRGHLLRRACRAKVL